ncbi:MAG: hypothetical protein NC489_34065 [Ruminococcus flavefaciens]|nr:hypothetical protein [Ruminococcus flavefaciens]
MVCMSRNKSRFFYALYVSKEQATDDYGNLTGGMTLTYDKPQEYRANISAAKGETQTRQFGESENYDKVIVMDGDAPPIDEYSILWIDTVPQLDEEGELATNEEDEVLTPHDYIVKKVARSLNSVSIAISKVNVQ